MNYSDFSFWWILLLFSVPFFSVEFLLSPKISPILLALAILLASSATSEFIYFEF